MAWLWSKDGGDEGWHVSIDMWGVWRKGHNRCNVWHWTSVCESHSWKQSWKSSESHGHRSRWLQYGVEAPCAMVPVVRTRWLLASAMFPRRSCRCLVSKSLTQGLCSVICRSNQALNVRKEINEMVTFEHGVKRRRRRKRSHHLDSTSMLPNWME